MAIAGLDIRLVGYGSASAYVPAEDINLAFVVILSIILPIWQWFRARHHLMPCHRQCFHVRRNQTNTSKVEQLVQLTNSDDFINDWAFYVTGLNLVPRTGKMIISLEAFYDQFEEQFSGHKKSWKIACGGFFDHHLHAGYLRPFYQIKILSDHPVLWNYGAETFFSVHGSCKDIPSLIGDLFLVHNKVCGNWVEFHNVFGFLPQILETETDNQLAAPTPLWQHYIKILKQYNVKYTVNETQQNQQLSALFFGSVDFPDNYNYGQPFVIAESFEILESA